VINTDLAPIYSSAIPDRKKEGRCASAVDTEPVQYLNNIPNRIIEPSNVA
jgi:transposase-like protein